MSVVVFECKKNHGDKLEIDRRVVVVVVVVVAAVVVVHLDNYSTSFILLSPVNLISRSPFHVELNF